MLNNPLVAVAASYLVFANIAFAQFSTIYTFNTETPTQVDGLNPIAGLVAGSDGNFYGTTMAGGSTSAGTIFKITPAGALTTLFSPGSASGLVQGMDGSFYGITNNNVSIFRITSGGAYSILATAPSPLLAGGLLAARDGNIYAESSNAIYQFTLAGAVNLVHTFTVAIEGSSPRALAQGSDGNLYGTTIADGPHGLGTFFQIATSSSTLAVIAAFPITVQNKNPDGSVYLLGPPTATIVQGSDGAFYGTSMDTGGTGVYSIFKITSTGTMTSLVPLKNFTTPPAPGTFSPQIGVPEAPMISGADGNLYGTTTVGSAGTIFELTTGGTLTVLYQFPIGAGNPSGLVQGSDGSFYGTTPATSVNSGTVFKLGPGSSGGSPPSITGLTLLDPVPDLVTPASASTTTGLVTDPNLLANNGRSVVGVAADGVSRVLLRGSTTSALTFTLLDENMNPVSPSNLQYGGLAAATVPASGFSNVVTIQPASVGGQFMAFVVYKSPIDFARPDPAFQSRDLSSGSRTVNIQIASSGGTSVSTFPVTIVRPPVVLVHGFTSEPMYWNTFTPLVASCSSSTVSADPRFFLECADYSRQVSGVNSIQPSYLFSGPALVALHPIKQNVLGFAYNAPIVFGQFQNTVALYAQSSAQAGGKPIAAVQVDVVGHSMGGLITRTMPYVLTAAPNSFRQAANFGQGIVHKLITIGSPHLGSPLSIAALDPANSCSWFGSAAIDEYPLMSATIAGIASPVSGGAADLAGDGQGNCVSSALGTLQGQADKQMPVALIAGEMSDAQLASLNSSVQAQAIHALSLALTPASTCSSDYLIQDYNSAGWLTLTRTSASSQSDAIVPVTSALNGPNGGQACPLNANQVSCHFTSVPGAVHGAGTVNEVGFAGPYLLQPITETPLLTINLLNASVSDPAFTVLPSNLIGAVGACK